MLPPKNRNQLPSRSLKSRRWLMAILTSQFGRAPLYSKISTKSIRETIWRRRNLPRCCLVTTPKFLYLAFRAFDEPDKIRSTVAKRDNIFSDDYVGFYLDTFNDQRKAFEMFFNPLGIQGDGVLTEGRGEDFSVDLLLESKGIIGC